MCPYQPAGWYWALSVSDPDRWAEVVEYERVALVRNPKMAATGHKGPGGKPMTLPEVVSTWRAANPDATVAAVLNKEYGRCTKEAKAALKAEMAEAEAGKKRVSLPVLAA
jgi:hypothetical protein